MVGDIAIAEKFVVHWPLLPHSFDGHEVDVLGSPDGDAGRRNDSRLRWHQVEPVDDLLGKAQWPFR
jgi:hypothetical protein